MKKYLWIVFIAMAGIFNACMDTVAHHYSTSVFTLLDNAQYFDASISWMNKYSNVETLTHKQWLGLIPTPESFTDAWHLFKSLSIVFMCIAIVTYKRTVETSLKIYSLIIDFIIARAAFGVAFTIFYNWILVK